MNKAKKLFGILLIVAMLFQTIGVKAETTGEPITPNGPAIIPEGYHKLNISDLVSSINHSKITESIKEYQQHIKQRRIDAIVNAAASFEA